MGRPKRKFTVESAPQETKNWEWASPQQEEMFKAGPSPLLASGGFNSAKTMGALFKLLVLADTYPGYRCIVARRFYSELKQTTFQTFLKLVPPQAYENGYRNDSEGVVQLNNGSRFMFIHLDRPDASSIIMGLEINAALLDQAEEMHEEVFDKLEARLGRWDRAKVTPEQVAAHEKETGKPWPWRQISGAPQPPSYMLLTCNPDVETHWLWRRFHPDSQEWQEIYKNLGYKMITFDSRDNKFAAKENIRIMESKDDAFQARYIRGEWGNAEGTLFRISPDSILEYTPELLENITRNCRLFRVLDHGDSAPTCCIWVAIDSENNAIIYREYYVPDASVRTHRDAIYSLSKPDLQKDGKTDNPRYRDNIADPAIFAKVAKRIGGRDVGNRWSVADEYADCKDYPRETAIFWRPSDNAEFPSRERLKDYLRVDPDHLHPISRKKGAPRLYFVKKTESYPNGCFQSITEVRSARRIQIGSMNGKPIFGDERDDNVPDHALDTVRYLVLSRPIPLTFKKSGPGMMTWDGYSKLMKEHKRLKEAMDRSYR